MTIPIYRRSDLKVIAGSDLEKGQAVGIVNGVAEPLTREMAEAIKHPIALYGIDPGPESSAIVGLNGKGIPFMVEIWPNPRILEFLETLPALADPDLLAIESMASYGMPVGDPVFVSCYWIGRFAQAYRGDVRLIKAPTVRAHLCGVAKAKKSHVRRALLDKYDRTGGGANPEIGTKGNPGPLYGFTSHAWSALAVAVCAQESDLGVVLP